MPSLNMPVQRLKVAILPLDLSCSGPVTHSGEFFNHWQVSPKDAGQNTNYKWIKNTQILDKLVEYKRNWIQHVNTMPRNRLARVMKPYSPTGRRNLGRPLKRLLDMWDLNGSTSGPTPWQIYDDDDFGPGGVFEFSSLKDKNDRSNWKFMCSLRIKQIEGRIQRANYIHDRFLYTVTATGNFSL